MTAHAQRDAQPAAAPVYHVHRAQREAIPARERGRLVNVLSVLCEHAVEVEGRQIVDECRTVLAEAAGVSVETSRRAERRLEELGLVRTLDLGANSRILEILAPPTVPLRPKRAPLDNRETLSGEGVVIPIRANRAVDNSGAQTASPPRPRGGGSLAGEGVEPLSPYLRERRIESIRAGARTRGDQTRAPEPQTDFADRAAGTLGRWVEDELGKAGTGDAYRLTRTQRAGVRESILERLRALERSGAGSAAEPTARRDLERLLGYALRADKPAAHLSASLRRRDWLSHVGDDSEAARVAEAGSERERPVCDDRREGPPEELFAGDLGRARERLARAIERAPITPEQRAQLEALTPTTAGEANELAASLERAAFEAARAKS